MDKNSHIYYVQQFDGQCIFKEINPALDDVKEHLTIYDIKSDEIIGLGVDDDGYEFHFMDGYKIVNKLQRKKDSKILEEVYELEMKDKDRGKF